MSDFHKNLDVEFEHAVYFSNFWSLHGLLRLLLAENDQKVHQQSNFHVFQRTLANRLNLMCRIPIFKKFTSLWSKGFPLPQNDQKSTQN